MIRRWVGGSEDGVNGGTAFVLVSSSVPLVQYEGNLVQKAGYEVM